MGMGASKEEMLDGTAVTGMWHKRVEMPPGVIGKQMPRGPKPGSKFLGFTPRLLQELNAARGSTSLYLEFEKTVVEECGGNNITGWQSKNINDVVTRFQPRFNEKGIHVAYSMVKWYVHHGQGGHMEYRYWLSFANLETVSEGVPIVEGLYDPQKDDQKMDADEEKLYKADEPFVVVGQVIEGKFASFDPTGQWIADMSTATGDIKKWVTKVEYSCTKNGNVYESTVKYKLSMLCFGVTKSVKATAQPVPGKLSEFMCISSDGMYSRMEINGPDSITSTDTSGSGSLVFNRVQHD
jgi:hypothetical protein